MGRDRTKVFISYSHQDLAWLRRLQVHLKPLIRDSSLDAWDDTRIRPGSQWGVEIRRAIDSAKVAVLLISADYLASDFIASDELPPLLQAAEREGAIILPVIVSPSRIARMESLARFQAVNDPSRPLVNLPKGEQEAVLDKVVEQIEGAVGRREMREKLASMQEQLDALNQRVIRLFLLSMSPGAYFNLKKIASGRFGPFEKTPMFERELYHLRSIGYVDAPSIKQIPRSGPDLSDHVSITPAGQEYVELREKMESNPDPSRDPAALAGAP